MHFTKSPETFRVEEVMQPILSNGKWHYYLMHKSGIDTPNAAKTLEKENETEIFYSGLKDANAQTTQWVCAEKKLKKPEDKRISIEYFGTSMQKIRTGMHSANRFTIRLEQITREDRETIKKISATFFPNYFDDQRFSAKNKKASELLLKNDWENALKSAMAFAEEFETEKSKEIKKSIAQGWGKWKNLAQDETLPLPKRKIFEMLQEKEDWKAAFAMLDKKTQRMIQRALQSLEFNRKLSEMIHKQKAKIQKNIEIAGENFPAKFSHKGIARKIEVETNVSHRNVLSRKTSFRPKKVGAKFLGDECTLSFEIPKGCYGTILVKCLLAKD